jgi:hypothetical protein
MNNKINIFVTISVALLSTILGLDLSSQSVFAQIEGTIRGASSAQSFQGNVLGAYTISLNQTEANITANMDIKPVGNNAFKAWLASNATQAGPTNYVSLGPLGSDSKISVVTPITNLTKYKLLVITEEPRIALNSTIPATPIAGAILSTQPRG